MALMDGNCARFCPRDSLPGSRMSKTGGWGVCSGADRGSWRDGQRQTWQGLECHAEGHTL